VRIAFWHFYTFRLLRGIETLIISLANALVDKGVDVSIVTAKGTTPPLISPDPRIRIFAFPAARYYSHLFITPFYINHFLHHRYDCVVTFFADFGEGAAWRVLNGFREIPLTVYLCYPYSAVPHRYRSFRKLHWELKARHILADATWIAREAEEFFGRPVGVVPVGTDPDRFRPDHTLREQFRRQLGFTESDVVLLNVSALERPKGTYRVIQAMSRLRGHFPELRYVVLGEGKYGLELRRLVEELQLRDAVIFGGTTTELEAFYNMADVFVMLPDSEGNSIACHEAMSCQLPVVVSNQGGFIESVPPTAGFLVDPDKPEEVDAGLSKLIIDPCFRLAKGQSGRAHIVENYSWNKIAERFLETIQ